MIPNTLHQITYCPVCASAGFTRNRLKAWYCGSCDFTYFHNAAAAVAGIIKYQQEILMTIRKVDPGQGMLDLPGGFVDSNESLEDGLSREVHEELGICVGGWRYLFSYPNQYAYKDIIYNTTDAFFTVDFNEKPDAVPCDDVAEIVWLSIHDIAPGSVAFNSIRHAIGRLQAKPIPD